MFELVTADKKRDGQDASRNGACLEVTASQQRQLFNYVRARSMPALISGTERQQQQLKQLYRPQCLYFYSIMKR